MKLVYMGTPDFAVPALVSLVEAGHEVAAVVTQPDKPKGRGKAVLMTPVKEKALSYGIPVYQPARVKKNEEFLNVLKEIQPDAIVVAAFGQILPREILELPQIRMRKYSPPPLLPQVQRSGSDSVGCHRRGEGERYYYHDDGCGT